MNTGNFWFSFLEDVIEEIVGDIRMFDDDNVNFTKIDEKLSFEGKINLDFYRIIEINEEIFEMKKGEAETLAGFILEISGNSQ
jgi:CBS domain containing-hemolysin-like protein